MISLPLEYQPIRRKLEQHLLSHPQDATKLAISHFENFLALTIKYQELQSQYENQPHQKLSLNFPLPLEYQFESERLKRHLKKYPDQAHDLAVGHYEDFINLSIEYKKLFSNNRLSSPCLPDFL